MEKKLWYYLAIEDPTFASGESVYTLLKHVLSVVPFKFVALSYIEGAGKDGKDGLIRSYKESKATILPLDEAFLNSLRDVKCFEWGNFFLFTAPPRSWDVQDLSNYADVIVQTDTTMRVIDGWYLDLYTPFKKIADEVEKNFVVKTYQLDYLTKYVYPE